MVGEPGLLRLLPQEDCLIQEASANDNSRFLTAQLRLPALALDLHLSTAAAFRSRAPSVKN